MPPRSDGPVYSSAEWETHGTTTPDRRLEQGMASSSPRRAGFREMFAIPAGPVSSTPHSQEPPWIDPPFVPYNITIDGNLTVFDDGSGNNQYGIITCRQLVAGNLTTSVQPSGDLTGVTDSANIQAAVNASGTALLVPGTYNLATTINLGPGQYVIGLGMGGTGGVLIKWLGSGDCFRQTFSGAYSGLTTVGGGINNLTIDGASHAVGASAGIHAGDIESLTYDRTYVRNFSGAGDIGYHFDNAVHWTERLQGAIRTNNCTTAVVFDVTGALTSTNSFARALLDILITSGGVTNNGVVLQNGALVYDGRIGIYGNFGAGASGSPGAVLTLTGTVPAGHPGAGNPSRILSSVLTIGVETTAGAVVPSTISFGAAANFIDAFGLLNFNTVNLFTVSNVVASGSQFRFSGEIIGDSSLAQTQYDGTWVRGAIATGQTIFPNQGKNVTVAPIAAVTGIIIAAGIRDGQELRVTNLSANSLTFAVAATSNVAAGASATVPANGIRDFEWNAGAGQWIGGV